MDNIILIRGGGDLATGVIQKFYRSGYNVVVTEVKEPTTIRRTVALSQAIYDKIVIVEDMTARAVEDINQIKSCFNNNEIPVIIDPHCHCLNEIVPLAVIDVIIAKRNLGTSKTMSNITIALGPGFTAGEDVDCVIETMRGHDLGRLIFNGKAMENTGIPGEIGGKSNERVIHAPTSGVFTPLCKIGDVVIEGQAILRVADIEVVAPFTGLLRGMLQQGITVKKGMKIADIDPRTDVDYNTISDKARCLGGSALEAFLYLSRKKI